jgi:hypothetical protein
VLASDAGEADDALVRVTLCSVLAVTTLALTHVAMAAGAEPLRGQWHLENPSCSDAPCFYPDSSGNDLTATGVNSPSTVPGRFGGAQHMINKQSFLTAGSRPLLQPEKVTVVAWVRASGTPGTVESVVGQGASAGCGFSSYAIYTGGSSQASGLRFYIYNGTSLFVTPPAGNGIWDGQWHMAAGTFDGTAVRLYIDGQQVGSGTPASGSIGYGLTANNEFVIGNYADPNACSEQTQFAGDVDEVRLYSRALSAAEIGRMAAATGTTPPDLVPDVGTPVPPSPSPSRGAVAAAVPGSVSKLLTGAVSVSAATSVPSAGGQFTDYHWVIEGPDKKLDFGCGAGATTMSHPFRKPGDYEVTLTVTDTLGVTATTTTPLTVAAAQTVPKLKDPYVFDCENPAAGAQADRPGCVKSFGFGIVDVNSRGRPEDCFQLKARINPDIFTKSSGAAQIEQVSAKALQVYTATIPGPVAINGLYLPVPQSVKTKYDSYNATIALDGADRVALQVGPFPTVAIPLNLKVTPDKHGVFHVVNVDQSAKAPKALGGLPIRGAFSVDLIRHASRVKVGLGLPAFFSIQGGKTVNGDAYLVSDNVHGVQFDGIALSVPQVFVGPLYVSNLTFNYLKSQNLWQGGATVQLPASPVSINASSPPPDFGFGLKNGKFDHAGFGVEFGIGARPDLFPPFHSVLLSHIGAAIGLNPLRLTGTIGLSSGEVVEEDGELFAAFASESTPYEFPDDVGAELAPLAGRTLDAFTLAVGGTASLKVPVLGDLPLLHSYGIYQYPDFFEFGGSFKFDVPLLHIEGGVNGFVFASKKLFNLEGGVKACLRGVELDFDIVSVKIDPCLNGGAVISSKGIGFCGAIPVPVPIIGVVPVTLGAGYHWGASTPDLKIFSCDYGEYREANPRAAQAGAPRTVTLPAGLDAAMLRVRGEGGDPRVSVTDPRGHAVPGGRDALILRAGNGTTLVALRKPAAGRWTVTAKPGSPAITGLASAAALPKLDVSASVRRKGSGRVLAYRISGAAGRKVTFAELGARTARQLGSASGSAGSIAFTPAPGRHGKRRIVALVEGAAGPAKRLSVATYDAPAPRRPAAPERLRAARARGRIAATWRRVPGIRRYEALVTLRDGTKAFRVVRSTRLRIADPYPGMRGTLTVDALAADGTRSRVTSAPLRAVRRR